MERMSEEFRAIAVTVAKCANVEVKESLKTESGKLRPCVRLAVTSQHAL
jgi:hypothetical protein